MLKPMVDIEMITMISSIKNVIYLLLIFPVKL